MKKIIGASVLALALSPMFGATAQAGTDAYQGEVFVTAANFCPRNTMEAAGQVLPINQNQSLFSLLGTTYGGDGRTSFGLPDLRQAAPSNARGGSTKYCIVVNGTYPSRP